MGSRFGTVVLPVGTKPWHQSGDGCSCPIGKAPPVATGQLHRSFVACKASEPVMLQRRGYHRLTLLSPHYSGQKRATAFKALAPAPRCLVIDARPFRRCNYKALVMGGVPPWLEGIIFFSPVPALSAQAEVVNIALSLDSPAFYPIFSLTHLWPPAVIILLLLASMGWAVVAWYQLCS